MSEWRRYTTSPLPGGEAACGPADCRATLNALAWNPSCHDSVRGGSPRDLRGLAAPVGRSHSSRAPTSRRSTPQAPCLHAGTSRSTASVSPSNPHGHQALPAFLHHPAGRAHHSPSVRPRARRAQRGVTRERRLRGEPLGIEHHRDLADPPQRFSLIGAFMLT